MLIKYRQGKKIFHFSTDDKVADKNIFTVIVGKNGTGKSRLMKSIIERIFGKLTRYGTIKSAHEIGHDLFPETVGDDFEIERWPDNVIAVSTSPFDKFPLNVMQKSSDDYSYLGIRTLRSVDLGTAYMANIYMSLLHSVIGDRERFEDVREVLDFLGYSENIEAQFNLTIPFKTMSKCIKSDDPVKYLIENILQNSQDRFLREKIKNSVDLNQTINSFEAEKIIELYVAISEKNNRVPSFVVSFDSNGVQLPKGKVDDFNDLIFLEKLGIARLRWIKLKKLNGKKLFMADASSGEQSVVMSVLGIASKIRNNSLICIDEPEICLHPEWQEKYIDILINTFRNFYGCHFLIATHSPLIVSKLRDENCYLLTMSDGKVTPAKEVNNRSADFQLARTFKTPGYKNEYLTRELVGILTIVSESGRLTMEDTKKISNILKLKEFIDKSDPVYKLMEIAQEVIGSRG